MFDGYPYPRKNRFSDLPALIAQGLETIANVYRETAKVSCAGSFLDPIIDRMFYQIILPTVMYSPSMETLHAVMLLAWLEYDNGQAIEFCKYCEVCDRYSSAYSFNPHT